MEINQPNEHEGAEPQQPTNAEIESASQSRIYVASLSDYNEGRLHGAWINAGQAPEDIEVEIQAVLATSPSGHAEEFAIFDFEGFGPWRPDEYESIATVALVAEGIDLHGPGFAHWVQMVDHIDPDALARFEDAYLGHWESVESYANDFVSSLGLMEHESVPEPFASYVHFDLQGFARDLELSGDITTSEGDGGVYVFEGHR